MCVTRSADVVTGLLHPTHQLGWRNAIGMREPNDCSQSGTLQASFKRAQDRSVYPEFDKNIHLRKSGRFANFAQHISEGSFRT